MRKDHLRLAAPSGEIHVMTVCRDGLELSSGMPAVVFSHGFTVAGFESHRMFIDIAERLADRGWLAVLFDYRGSGYSDLGFAEMTIASEVTDLTTVLAHTRSLIGTGSWLSLWGSSMGTAIAAEVAAQPESSVNALVEWSLSAELRQSFEARHAADFARQGYSILPAGFIIRPALLASMRHLDTYASLRSLRIPRLFVSGDADTATSIEMAERAVSEARGDVTLVRIPGGVHGFSGQPDLFEDALSQTIAWLETRRDMPDDGLPVVERAAVRLVVLDAEGKLLLFHTKDIGNPDLGTWWELPGGGIEPGETYHDAAVRELREETGISAARSRVGPPAWRRLASFRYRRERRLQHEVIVTVRLPEAGPGIDESLRLDYEKEDYFGYRWWPVQDVLSSAERFYPGSLPALLAAFLAGQEISEPFELWS